MYAWWALRILRRTATLAAGIALTGAIIHRVLTEPAEP